MKSNAKLVPAAWLHFLLSFMAPCMAAEKQVCEVAVAALNLPEGSDGLLHWRVGDSATVPLQLSTRYFSERLKLPGRIIQFHKNPVPVGSAKVDPPPVPLLTLTIPERVRLAYIVLSSEAGAERQPKWRGNMLNAEDWKIGSMRVFNAFPETVGIAAGEKRIQLLQGKSVDFHARDWGGEAFPVKILRLRPETKTLFSSTWRVSEGRRELCFIGNANGAVTLRSLLELVAHPE